MSVVSADGPEAFAIGRAIADTFGVIGRNIGLILGLAALLCGLPMLIFEYFVPGAVLEDTAILPESSQLAEAVLLLLFGLIEFGLMAILLATVSRIAIDDLEGRKPSFDTCLETGVTVALSIAGIVFLSCLPLFFCMMLLVAFETFLPDQQALGIVVFVIPTVYILLRWFLAIPVQVQERCGVLTSMKRSATLSRGSRWGLFSLMVVVATVASILSVPIAFLAVFLPARGVAFGAGIVSAVFPTVLVVAAAVSYLQLRVIKEGSGI